MKKKGITAADESAAQINRTSMRALALLQARALPALCSKDCPEPGL
jgi:hypothetical protein